MGSQGARSIINTQQQIMTDIQHADDQLCYKLLHSNITSDDLTPQ